MASAVSTRPSKWKRLKQKYWTAIDAAAASARLPESAMPAAKPAIADSETMGDIAGIQKSAREKSASKARFTGIRAMSVKTVRNRSALSFVFIQATF